MALDQGRMICYALFQDPFKLGDSDLGLKTSNEERKDRIIYLESAGHESE